MTPEKEAELFATLATIGSRLARIEDTLATHTAQFADLRGDIKAINARLDEQRAWLQSTDQRFTAIMVPHQPRAS